MLAQSAQTRFRMKITYTVLSDLPVPTLHKKLTCVMLAHSPQTTLHRKIIYNFVWIYMGQHCIRKLLAHAQDTTFMRKTCWNNIAQEYCLVNVVQICLRQHCTRKLLSQCWLKAHRYTFAEKPGVSNMSGSLVLTGYYITEQSWLFLFSVGSGVHLATMYNGRL